MASTEPADGIEVLDAPGDAAPGDDAPVPAPAVDPAPSAGEFAAFYDANYRRVVHLMLLLTGRIAEAEELAQDAFVAAHERWSSVGAYDDPGAWVRRVAANKATSLRRRAVTELARRARLARRDGDRAQPDPQLPDPRLWAAVRALPLRQRQVLAMVVLDDRPVAECAEALGCGEATVRTHLHRARLALADALGTPGGGDG